MRFVVLGYSARKNRTDQVGSASARHFQLIGDPPAKIMFGSDPRSEGDLSEPEGPG